MAPGKPQILHRVTIRLAEAPITVQSTRRSATMDAREGGRTLDASGRDFFGLVRDAARDGCISGA